MDEYLSINKALWDAKTEIHVDSDFYNLKGFIAGNEILNEPELKLLGNVTGKKILHLQCHFGMDSLALARMGAHVTGVDLSSKAIEKATELNKQLELNARFIESDIYELPSILNEQFDIVFTSYGTIGWLPDMDKWASVVQHFLKPNGKFILVEFHPVIWMMNEDFSHIKYHYFNIEPIIETLSGTYADTQSDIEKTEISWNHSLDEVISSLLNNQLNISSFKEYNYSPYPCFTNLTEIEKNKYQVKGIEGKLPMVYSILSTKNSM